MSTPTATPRRRRWIRLLLLIAAQVVAIVVGLEIGLRLLRPHHSGIRQLLFRSTEATRFDEVSTLEDLMNLSPVGFRPGAAEHGFVLNSRSFRTVEYDREKSPDTYRVLAVGDSFTYGVVPDVDHWTTHLERGLEARRSDDVEVLRLGVPGIGTPFELRLWQIEGRTLDADLVVLAFFVGNDFQDELGNAPGLAGAADRLALVSYGFRLLRNLSRVGFVGKPAGGLTADGTPPPTTLGGPLDGGFELPGFVDSFSEDRPTMDEQEYLRIEAERMSICLRRERWKFDLRFQRVASLLRRFAAEVRDEGSAFVVLIIPDDFQVDRDLFLRTAAFSGHEESDYDLQLPQEALRALFEEQSIDFVDLLTPFRERALTTRLYMIRDSHWNRSGNRLAAERLLASITDDSTVSSRD